LLTSRGDDDDGDDDFAVPAVAGKELCVRKLVDSCEPQYWLSFLDFGNLRDASGRTKVFVGFALGFETFGKPGTFDAWNKSADFLGSIEATDELFALLEIVPDC